MRVRLTFDAPAPLEESADVALDGAVPNELVSDQVRVVRARDKVLGQRASHVVRDLGRWLGERAVVGRRQERREAVQQKQGFFGCLPSGLSLTRFASGSGGR